MGIPRLPKAKNKNKKSELERAKAMHQLICSRN
jgi:hypothetical protein